MSDPKLTPEPDEAPPGEAEESHEHEEAWAEIGRYVDPTLGKLTLDFLRQSGIAVRVNGASPDAINPYRLTQVTALLVRAEDVPRAREALLALENPLPDPHPATAYRINSVPDADLEQLVATEKERKERAEEEVRSSLPLLIAIGVVFFAMAVVIIFLQSRYRP